MSDEVISLDDPRALNKALCGAKAANLAYLLQKSMPVPRGIVITSSAIKGILEGACPEPPTGGHFLGTDIEQKLLGYTSRYPDEARFAVRSSATVEDGSELSFAGQFHTALNCTKAGISAGVTACVRSAFSDRVRTYAGQTGSNQQIDMAVLIQEMIDPDVAGVMFTVNPANGNANELCISFAEGNGTSVVEGSGDSSEIIVDKSGDNPGAGDEGALSHGGVGKLRYDEVEALRVCANAIEQAFAYPQDIEWCMKDHALWVLQARPITSVSAQWTRDETAERFPNRMTPLAWSVVQDVFHKSMGRSLQIMKLPPFKGDWFSQNDFAIYGNQSAMEFYRYILRLKTSGPNTGLSAVTDMLKRLEWAEAPLNFWRSNIDGYLIRFGRAKNLIESNRDIESLWEAVEALRDLTFDYFAPNIAISMGHGALYGALSELVAWVNKSQPVQIRMEHLTAGCETKTSELHMAVIDLAAIVNAHPALANVVRQSDTTSAIDAMREVPEVADALDHFVTTHGHREVDHFLDPYFPSLGEQPHLIATLVKAHLGTKAKMDGGFLGAEKLRYRSELMTFLVLFPEQIRPHVLSLVELARRYIEIDDVEHYHTTRLQSLFRIAVSKVGHEFQKKGVLQEPLDLFFATYADVRNLKLGIEPERILQSISEVKARFQMLGPSEIPWGLDQTSPSKGSPDQSLRGVPCSSGTAQGTVFKVLGMEDMAQFPHGAILVAQAALPAWTPLFHHAAAIVTQGGGPLSHAAIVAREIGIPAVMGVKGCLQSLSDGDIVRVDGASGMIQMVN